MPLFRGFSLLWKFAAEVQKSAEEMLKLATVYLARTRCDFFKLPAMFAKLNDRQRFPGLKKRKRRCRRPTRIYMVTRNVELGRYQFAHVAVRGSLRPNSTRNVVSRTISAYVRTSNPRVRRRKIYHAHWKKRFHYHKISTGVLPPRRRVSRSTHMWARLARS